MSRLDDARSLFHSLYDSTADILPDYENRKITVRLHQPSYRCNAVAIENLCRELNMTGTKFPGKKLQLVYELVS